MAFGAPAQLGVPPSLAPMTSDPELGDSALVVAARADPQAFAALYARYQTPIYGYYMIRLRQRKMAEDATNDIFLRALIGLDRYRGGNFAAWLFQIARHVVIDTVRRRRLVEPLTAQLEPRDSALLPDEAAVVQDALERLPEDQRAVIELGCPWPCNSPHWWPGKVPTPRVTEG